MSKGLDSMNAKVLCSLLGLPEQPWPPEHHTLLGLPPGERDVALVEQRVHERMTKPRCLQLSHPDEATEWMNRIAQAFIELSERISQHAAVAAPPQTAQNTAVQLETNDDWRSAPPPVRSPTVSTAAPAAH